MLIFFFISFYLSSHIYKLFDRSVDFAKYNNDTSLYVLARAWMKNKPHEMETISSFENSSTSVCKAIILSYLKVKVTGFLWFLWFLPPGNVDKVGYD